MILQPRGAWLRHGPEAPEEIAVSCIATHDTQLSRLASAIAQRVGPQRFRVWFDNSTRLDLRHDALEIAVPNDFISEWIGKNFAKPIQEAAHEVLGCSLSLRFSVQPGLFQESDKGGNGPVAANRHAAVPRTSSPCTSADAPAPAALPARPSPQALRRSPADASVPRLRHDMETFVVGPGSQLAYNAACYVAEFPGAQYNPLFIHGACGLGKTHLVQGLCRRFAQHHPTLRWIYLTGEEFTNEFLLALRNNKLEAFRRNVRDLDLLAIDDVHFLAGKKATQEEFLHTFNAIEALGRQVVLASDSHPKMIAEFGESLTNRFVSGMVVRIDPPNYATRCQILRQMAHRSRFEVPQDVIDWIARRVTTNVRELEGALTRISAHVRLTGAPADRVVAAQALADLDRNLAAPVRPENIVRAVCGYFNLEPSDLLSSRRQRTISLARSLAMFLVRRLAQLSFPEISAHMGRRNHSTVISACRRMERAIQTNQTLVWTSSVGERQENALDLVQRLEELSRSAA